MHRRIGRAIHYAILAAQLEPSNRSYDLSSSDLCLFNINLCGEGTHNYLASSNLAVAKASFSVFTTCGTNRIPKFQFS